MHLIAPWYDACGNRSMLPVRLNAAKVQRCTRVIADASIKQNAASPRQLWPRHHRGHGNFTDFLPTLIDRTLHL
jgi:hypothetical protein